MHRESILNIWIRINKTKNPEQGGPKYKIIMFFLLSKFENFYKTNRMYILKNNSIIKKNLKLL